MCHVSAAARATCTSACHHDRDKSSVQMMKLLIMQFGPLPVSSPVS